MMEYERYGVYCNISLSFKVAFLRVEKTMFTVATLVQVFTVIALGHYACSKQRKTIHAKSNLKVNCEKKSL